MRIGEFDRQPAIERILRGYGGKVVMLHDRRAGISVDLVGACPSERKIAQQRVRRGQREISA